MTGDTKRKPSNDQSGGSTDGRALFVDCDVVFLRDPVEVLQYAETAPTAGIESGPPDTTAAPAQGEPHDYDALRADALGRICEHGQLARSCDHCDNAREIAELHATVERQALEIAELRAMLQTANQANGRLAELAYKYKWQVRDTCTRAERAEAERDALQAQLREIARLWDMPSDAMPQDWRDLWRAAIDAARKV